MKVSEMKGLCEIQECTDVDHPPGNFGIVVWGLNRCTKDADHFVELREAQAVRDDHNDRVKQLWLPVEAMARA